MNTTDEMNAQVEDYDLDDSEDYEYDLEEPECEFCEDHGCSECNPDDFAEMHLKWTCDGASTIDGAVAALQGFIEDLNNYQAAGFELTEPVDNSHFFLDRLNAKAATDSSSETQEQ